jgi:hypothetical protein
MSALLSSLSHSVEEADLQPGDHLYVHRLLGVYQHHGVYVGNGQVIHWYKADSKSLIIIERTSLAVFKNGDDVQLRRVRYDVSLGEWVLKLKGSCSRLHADPSRDAIVARAEGALAASQHQGAYHLLFNNCEKFARYCVTSLIAEQGEQVLAWTQRLLLAGAVVVTLFGARYLLADLPHLLPHVPVIACGSTAMALQAAFIWIAASEVQHAEHGQLNA